MVNGVETPAKVSVPLKAHLPDPLFVTLAIVMPGVQLLPAATAAACIVVVFAGLATMPMTLLVSESIIPPESMVNVRLPLLVVGGGGCRTHDPFAVVQPLAE